MVPATEKVRYHPSKDIWKIFSDIVPVGGATALRQQEPILSVPLAYPGRGQRNSRMLKTAQPSVFKTERLYCI